MPSFEATSAAATVDLFLTQEVPLLNAGQGLVSSKEKTNAFSMPVVALVNYHTSAAAEAMAVGRTRPTSIG